jgi:hypothetical protein
MASVDFVDVKQIAPELGVFFIVSLTIYFMFMNKIRGKIQFIEVYIASRDWDFLSSPENLDKNIGILKFIMVSILMTPVFCLLMWVGTLLYVEAKDDQKYETRIGISTFFVCAAVILTLSGIGNMKWERFKLNKNSIILMVFGLLSYVTFLFVVIFMQSGLDFIGISAIFISGNAIVVFFIIVFMQNKTIVTVDQVLSKLEPIEDIANEIKELYTIPRVPDEKVASAVSGGPQVLFTSQRFVSKRSQIFMIFYVLGLGILVAYSIISHGYSEYYSLGILNSILIESVDLLVFFFAYAGILSSAGSTVLISLVTRFFIFILTGEYWFIGYSCVYWVFSLYVVGHFVNHHFPLMNGVNDLITNAKDLGRTVEFTYFSVLITYIVLILAITIGEPSGIPYTTIYLQEHKLPLWLIGICSIIISIVYSLLRICIRLMFRRIHGIKDTVEYFLFFKSFSLFWIFGLVALIICWSSAVAIYLTVESTVLIVMLSILPLIILLNLSLYANWAKNDYSIVKDPKLFNNFIQKKIKSEEECIEKVRKYQEEYLEKSSHLLDQSFALKGNSESFSKNLSKRSMNPREAQFLKLGLINPDKLREVIPALMPDWTSEMSIVSAFFKRRLLKSDYINIAEVFLSITLTCIMAGIIYGVDRQMKYGVTSAVMILSLTLVLYPLQHNLYTSIPFGFFNIASIIFGVLLNFSYGYIYYHFELGQNSDSSKNGINVFFNTFVIPILVSYTYGIYKLYSDDWKIQKYSKVMLLLSQIFSIGGSIVILFIDVGAGIAMFGFFFVIFIYVAIFVKYCSEGFKLSYYWVFFLIILTAIIGLSGVGIGIALDSLGIYAGFSISYLFFSLLFIGYSVVIIIKNLRKTTTAPVFFSPWVFPIYKYNPKTRMVEKADEMGKQLMLGLNLILFWAISCIIWMSPAYIGVSVGCLCIVLILLIFIFLSIISPVQLADALKLLNTEESLKTLKKAWNECKTKMLEKQGAVSFEDFPSFYERFQKLNDLQGMIVSKQYSKPQSDNPAWKRLHTELKDLRDYLTEYYLEDTSNNDQYILELELAIHFQLLIVLSAFSSKTSEIMLHNSLILSKSVELKAFGIVFTVDRRGKTLAEKYSHIMQEVSKLNHIQRTRFEDIKEQFQIELEEQRLKRKRQAEEEEKAIAARMEAVKNLHEQRQQKLKDQSVASNIPIEEMVDCMEKYQKIVETCKKAAKKFEDSQFPLNDTMLGFTAHNISGWKRAEGCVLYEGGVTASDVKQGAIGDCYFLSAISVLGEKRTKDIFVSHDLEVGVYLMKFYKYGDPVYVIVDDQFPVNSEQKWAFAQTVSGTELWPNLLEKAYAKLNGGYQNIVAGKVHYALSDLTGGQPEEIKLEALQNNPDALWLKLLSYKDCNYPMGAGSPENPMGDAAVSQSGIVQGHAYSVLDVQEVTGEKVVQLKNPHGQHGQEWRGDWSDGSSKWTKQAINKLHYEEKPDGIFWMSLEDFSWEYKNLYICRIFDDPKWKKLEANGEWTGKRAAGFPCKDNPGAKVEDNPQYALKLSKSSLAFITLTQKSAVDMFKGKSPIMFLVFTGGKRVADFSKGMVGSSGKPTDLKIVSNEINLDKGDVYTILVTSMYQGERGTGGFELTVTVDDQKASLVEIN